MKQDVTRALKEPKMSDKGSRLIHTALSEVSETSSTRRTRTGNSAEQSSSDEEDACESREMDCSTAFMSLLSAPRELWVIFLLKYMESYAYFVFAYTLILFLSEEFRFSDEEAAWAYGLYGMLMSVYGFLMGTVIDNLGVKWSLVMGMSLLFVSRVVLTFTTNSHLLAIVLFTLLPLGGSMGVPVMQISVKRFTTRQNCSVAFSFFYMMMNIAAITAAPCIDAYHKAFPNGIDVFLGGSYSYMFHISSYRLLILTGSAVTLLSLSICLLVMRDPKEVVPEAPSLHESERGRPLHLIKKVLDTPSFWRFFALVVLLLGVRLVYRHLDATFPKYMVRSFGRDAMYGSVIAINPLCVVIMVPLIAPLAMQFHPLQFIIIGSFISAISPFILALGHNYVTAICFVTTLSVGEAIWSPRLYEYTLMVAEPGREGTYMALASAPMFLATLLTGASSGWLLDTFCAEKGPRHAEVMWIIIGLTSILSPVLLYVFKDSIQGPEHEVPVVGKRKDKVVKATPVSNEDSCLLPGSVYASGNSINDSNMCKYNAC